MSDSNDDPMRDIGKLVVGHVGYGPKQHESPHPVLTGSTALAVESKVLRARIAELEAQLAKLPETADKVRWEPGMKLWYLDIRNGKVSSTIGLDYCEQGGVDPTQRWFCDEHNAFLFECYSTRDAALAAKGGE